MEIVGGAKMGSRDDDRTTAHHHHHQPLLSSLVVRASNSDGAGGDGGGGGCGANDYEPGEVRRDLPAYSRSDRYSDKPGYRIRAGSRSPVRRRDPDHYYNSDFDRFNGLPRNREFSSGKDSGRYRDSSPPYGRGRVGSRPLGRGFDRPGFGPGPLRGGGTSRNNPNVRPREGDWICPDPSCGNLNFARREQCNSCNRFRHGGGSPRRGYRGPPHPLAPPGHFPGPPVARSPVRNLNGHRSPLRGGSRDGAGDLPSLRHEGRFSDQHPRRARLDYPDDEYRGRNKFDRPMPMEWGPRDRGRDSFFNDRKGFERQFSSPPPPPLPLPPRGRWAQDVRERSRSPIRGGPPPKDYRRDMYMERGRDDRRGVARGRIRDAY